MNNNELGKYDREILHWIYTNGLASQRIIADETGISLGQVNKSINKLYEKEYITKDCEILDKTIELIKTSRTQTAIILAAGYGLRMAPINADNPKGLLQVKGEILIERIIKQLRKADINKIYIVVGYMKEKFEYLIDQFNVELICNSDYSEYNNLHSLAYAKDYIGNTYIIPSDVWCEENPFKKYEPYSWYMVTNTLNDASTVKINRNGTLLYVNKKESGNKMIGISYIGSELATSIVKLLVDYDSDGEHKDCFWEEVLRRKEKMCVFGKLVDDKKYTEINTYEQLRELDENSNNLKTEAIKVICNTLGIGNKDICNIEILKKGMTNRSFLFSCQGKRYIMRIPGEGTAELIDRKREVDVYKAIAELEICDNIAYINSENGYKITEYIENARVCNPDNEPDVVKCMNLLKQFHNMSLVVDHEFDLYEQILFYEKLMGEKGSVYGDYYQTKEEIFGLRPLVDTLCKTKCLTHIDAVPDNFLFYDIGGMEKIALIDWEYAGMQDPHVDIAMFAIYAMYDKKRIDELIDIYFENSCSDTNRIKIYCYIAICGLLWSNWCEYKRKLGVEFGEYSIRQYRYAKDYCRIVKEMTGYV